MGPAGRRVRALRGGASRKEGEGPEGWDQQEEG